MKKGRTIKAGLGPNAAEAELARIEAVVDELRAHPGRFPDAPAVAMHAKLSERRLGALLRRHYHATLENLLRRARLEAAKRLLLRGDEAPAKIARAVGYATAAVFQDDFKIFNGLTPLAYRALRVGQSFSVFLPEGYPLGYLRRALGRDRHSVTERLDSNIYRTAVRLGEGDQVVTLTLAEDRVIASLSRATVELSRVHALVVGLLGLEQDAAVFARWAGELNLPQLVEGRHGLRVVQTPTVFDGLLWAIVGQQINFPFACLLKRRLIEKTGTAMADGLYASPAPQAVARLEPRDLLPLQFSRQKADYVIAIARLIADGKLDLEALRLMSATRAERTLLAVRGLGPWSVNYVMMRALGFADCLPLGDTGVTSGLQALFQLKTRPDAAATRRLMARFSPFRSLATAHLWQLGQPVPA